MADFALFIALILGASYCYRTSYTVTRHFACIAQYPASILAVNKLGNEAIAEIS